MHGRKSEVEIQRQIFIKTRIQVLEVTPIRIHPLYCISVNIIGDEQSESHDKML